MELLKINLGPLADWIKACGCNPQFCEFDSHTGLYACIAQGTEHLTTDQGDGSSNLSAGTMNFYISATFHPKNLNWKWLPELKHKSWPLSKGGRVWYFNIEWLNYYIQIDNEW